MGISQSGKIRHIKHLIDRRLIIGFVFYICAGALLIWVWLKLSRLGFTYEWQWNRAWRQFGTWTANGFEAGPLCKGLILTLGITAWGAVFSCLTGLCTALLRLSPWPFCEKAAICYVGVWRNTPLLLQLFFIYFLVSPLLNLNPFWSAVLSLSAFEGAYLAEIFRGAILSVSRTQWEAALSLGFPVRQSFFLVIFPQAVRYALPALTGQCVALIKDTSLVSAIAVADITLQAQAIVAETFLAFEVWLIVALIYFLLTLCVSLAGYGLERFSRWN